MGKVIIYNNEFGCVTCCYPTGEVPLEVVLQKDIPADADAYVVEYEDLLNDDRDFYDAWIITNGKLSVRLEKAKEITKNRLRTDRAPILAKLDVDYMKALEQGQDTTLIVAEKQRLRDITGLADTAKTLDELRNLKVV